jgi:hypothetical protein
MPQRLCLYSNSLCESVCASNYQAWSTLLARRRLCSIPSFLHLFVLLPGVCFYLFVIFYRPVGAPARLLMYRCRVSFFFVCVYSILKAELEFTQQPSTFQRKQNNQRRKHENKRDRNYLKTGKEMRDNTVFVNVTWHLFLIYYYLLRSLTSELYDSLYHLEFSMSSKSQRQLALRGGNSASSRS